MQKMYLQLFLTLASFFGALFSLLYTGMSYLYYYQEAPKYAGAMRLSSTFWMAIVVFLFSLGAFIACIFWVRQTQKSKQEKKQHYHDVMNRK